MFFGILVNGLLYPAYFLLEKIIPGARAWDDLLKAMVSYAVDDMISTGVFAAIFTAKLVAPTFQVDRAVERVTKSTMANVGQALLAGNIFGALYHAVKTIVMYAGKKKVAHRLERPGASHMSHKIGEVIDPQKPPTESAQADQALGGKPMLESNLKDLFRPTGITHERT